MAPRLSRDMCEQRNWVNPPQAALGEIFSGGTLVKIDYEQSVRWYTAAAVQGLADGVGLGCRYLLGQGVPTDLNEAFRWFKLAADQNHPVAQYDLGRMYDFGQGTEKDPASALLYYENAAQQGVPMHNITWECY